MKERLYSIPVNEAFEAEDECPFCYLRRQTEQRAIRYVAGPGASYMEPDIRAKTNRLGFCPGHMQKVYDYGNPLGAALMLQTHYEQILEEMHENLDEKKPEPKQGFLRRKRPQRGERYWNRLEKRVESCYICEKIEDNMRRYLATFFNLTKEQEFRAKVEKTKGFCLPHFAKLLELEEELLPQAQRAWFCDTVIPKTEGELLRVKQDLDWFIAKHDYRNAGADWGNSVDALSRAMQKLAGIYPSDPPYRDE